MSKKLSIPYSPYPYRFVSFIIGISLRWGGFGVWVSVCMNGWQIGVQNGTERD